MNRLRIIGGLMAGMCLLTGCSHSQSTPAPSPTGQVPSAASTPTAAASDSPTGALAEDRQDEGSIDHCRTVRGLGIPATLFLPGFGRSGCGGK